MTETKPRPPTRRLPQPFPPLSTPPGEVLMNTFAHAFGQPKPLRLLVPINANADSRWGVRYALQRHLEDAAVEVILLNVGEIVTQWQVLRFRTQQEVAQFQAERAQAFIDEASAPLAAENIPYRGVFKQGDVVFSILDAAEEFDCDEIAMPAPQPGLTQLFSRAIAAEVRRQRGDIPVVMVDSEGLPH